MCDDYNCAGVWQVEDSTVEIETLRQQLGALEKRQKTLEQNLREEKATSERYITREHCYSHSEPVYLNISCNENK